MDNRAKDRARVAVSVLSITEMVAFVCGAPPLLVLALFGAAVAVVLAVGVRSLGVLP